jgi:hypothetical protein
MRPDYAHWGEVDPDLDHKEVTLHGAKLLVRVYYDRQWSERWEQEDWRGFLDALSEALRETAVSFEGAIPMREEVDFQTSE